MKIFIDPGHNHQGADTGAQGNGLKEQDITYLIASKLKKLLEAAGHSVEMSRGSLTGSVGKTLSESINTRAELSNKWGAELFVSIHCNAFDGIAKGTETLVYSKGGKAAALAQMVQNTITERLGTNDRGVKERPDLGVLRLTKAPAILVETAFIDNVADSEKLSYRQSDFAEAIFEGITGEPSKKAGEPSEINDIVWEFANRGIITDKELWLGKLKDDKNAYHLARKTLDFMRRSNV